MLVRHFSSAARRLHQNPLGLPQRNAPPQLPRRHQGPIVKRPIPHVKHVIAVASGKGGVGKSTVAVNLAFALAQTPGRQRARVGILDLDIFGPSIPKLMNLESVDEPELTEAGALMPVANHGLSCMSMGFLLPKAAPDDPLGPAVVWRGLMVQKAVQQLLFDVDWRGRSGIDLDVLVVDMPPGTGDVQLTMGQLVKVDGAVIVSTPQDVALLDVRKGVSMFHKVSVPILGLLLNMSHLICSSCTTRHEIFGSSAAFHSIASSLNAPVLGELPLVSQLSENGDKGIPAALIAESSSAPGMGDVKRELDNAAIAIWRTLDSNKSS